MLKWKLQKTLTRTLPNILARVIPLGYDDTNPYTVPRYWARVVAETKSKYLCRYTYRGEHYRVWIPKDDVEILDERYTRTIN